MRFTGIRYRIVGHKVSCLVELDEFVCPAQNGARPVNRTGAFAINSEFDDVFAGIETGPAAIDNQQGLLSIS